MVETGCRTQESQTPRTGESELVVSLRGGGLQLVAHSQASRRRLAATTGKATTHRRPADHPYPASLPANFFQNPAGAPLRAA